MCFPTSNDLTCVVETNLWATSKAYSASVTTSECSLTNVALEIDSMPSDIRLPVSISSYADTTRSMHMDCGDRTPSLEYIFTLIW